MFRALGITDEQIDASTPLEIATLYLQALTNQALREHARRISITDFVLDGKALATQAAAVSIAGIYIKQGDTETLYATTQALVQSRYSASPNVPLLTEDAARPFRARLLACQTNPATAQLGCPVTVLGTVTVCTETSAFGVSRDLPCVRVADGQ